MKYIGFIPARKGSKGIPRKNVKLLNGKPLISYSIEAALKSNLLKDIFVSTDDDEVLDIAKSYNLSTDYKRPDHLASDTSSMVEAMIDAVNFLKSKDIHPENLILLQPTSPLRESWHIDQAIEAFEKADSKTLVGVSEMIEHPFECLTENDENWNYLAKPSSKVSRRQDYKSGYYFINGAMYITNVEHLLSNKEVIEDEKALLFKMDKKYGVDIDQPLDFIMAEAVLKNNFI